MTRITYQTETCSRCCGTGHYSYCQTHGTTCFQCEGTGKQHTREAKRALAAIRKFKERYHRPAGELEPGMVVLVDLGARRWRTVVATRMLDSVSKSLQRDGSWKEHRQMMLSFKNIETQLMLSPETMMEVRYTPEQFTNELLPFARTLKGVIIEE